MYRTELTEPWLTALESGSYLQDSAAGRLKSDVGWCCLGVAADVADRLAGGDGSWVSRWKHTGSAESESVMVNPHCESRRDEGLSDRDQSGEFLDDPGLIGATEEEMKLLATWNDDRVEFQEIARWVRENLDSGRDLFELIELVREQNRLRSGRQGMGA